MCTPCMVLAFAIGYLPNVDLHLLQELFALANPTPCLLCHECDGDTLDAIHTTLARSYLDLEVTLDEFYTVLLRIKLFCHIIAVCLVALTLIEGTHALSCIVDSVQRWAAFAYHALT